MLKTKTKNNNKKKKKQKKKQKTTIFDKMLSLIQLQRQNVLQNPRLIVFNVKAHTRKIKALTALVSRSSLSVGWENGSIRGLKTVLFNLNFL